MIRRTSPLLKKENKVTKGGIVKEGAWDSFQVLIKFEYIFSPHLVVKYLRGLGRATISNNTERCFLSRSGEEIGTPLGQWTLAGTIRQAPQRASQA